MAYGDHSHAIYASSNTWSEIRQTLAVAPAHSHSLFNNNPLYGVPVYLTKEEVPMTTIQKIRAERKEARERERVNAAYAEWDAYGLDRLAEGDVLRFDVSEGAERRLYAAVRADGRWWATGGRAPNGVDTEDFVAWLIDKGVGTADVEVRT